MNPNPDDLSDDCTVDTAGEGLCVRLTIEGKTIEVPVLDVSKGSLRVACPEQGEALKPGAALPAAELEIPGSTLFTLDLKVAARGLPARAGEAVFQLEPVDDQTRASLWLALEALRGLETKTNAPALFTPPSNVQKIPARGRYTEEARLERLAFIREESGENLETLQDTMLQSESLTGNVENMVGSVEIPVGLAGPLWFKGAHVQGPVYAPLATTEGALVASATRGATALSRSGGIVTRVLAQRMMRVPLFVLSDLRGAEMFAQWVLDHIEEIVAETRKVSRYARLVKVEPRILGKMVHLLFGYETGDAAGQNMTTACTWHACQWVMSQMKFYEPIRFENFIIEANMSGDKKVNYNSFISGRGTRVMAEAFVSEEALEKTLKVSSKALLDAHRGFLAGSIGIGMVGFNINVANIVAAIFTATGQDIACVHESSLAQLHLEEVDGGIHISLLLPALIVGTVGGGTHLPRQQDLLKMMGCAGQSKVGRLAEIIAGFSMALDLSTLSAIASGQFATAHERLGRNRPVEWFQAKDLNPAFFESRMRECLEDPGLCVEGIAPIDDFSMGSSIITELTARKVNKLVGHFPFRIDYQRTGRQTQSAEVIAKVKPLDDEVVLMVNSLANMCGGTLAGYYNKFKDRMGFNGCHRREIGIYAQKDARFRRHAPEVYGLVSDDKREAYIVIMERLKNMVLMDSANDPTGWTRQHIESVLRGIGEVHAIWLGREEELVTQQWLGPVMTAADMVEMTGLWESLKVHGSEEFPEQLTRRDLQFYLEIVRSLDSWWPELEAMPRTLIHNDFNPRNVALRPDGDGHRLCAYDWELATMQVPQHDVAEFLCFTLPLDATRADLEHYVEVHRQALEEASGIELDPLMCFRAFELSAYDLVVNRFALYMMAHTFRQYPFMEHVTARTRHLIERIRKG